MSTTQTSHIVSSSASSSSKRILLVRFLHVRVLSFFLLVILLSFAEIMGEKGWSEKTQSIQRVTEGRQGIHLRSWETRASASLLKKFVMVVLK